MKSCLFCAESIQDEAVVCRSCGRGVPVRATSLAYQGSRFALGSTETGYAIWDVTLGGEPVSRYPRSDEGWSGGWARYQELEGAASGQGPTHAGVQRTNGMAVASLVLGILWVYWIGSILALVFGYLAKSEIDRSGGMQAGRGLAIAGIVLGWVGVGILALLVVLVVVGSIAGSA